MLQKALISEIDIEIITLNQAIRDHFSWSNKFFEYSLFGDRADVTYTDPQSHLHCTFSYWLRMQLAISDENADEINAIQATHEIMHDAMRELLLSVQYQQVKRDKLNNYFHAQMHFLQATDAYKTSLISLRNCYDTLTGLPLRQLLYKDFNTVVQHLNLPKSKLYLCLIDIDFFKSVNDTWGHNVGDVILKDLAHLLSSSVRAEDRVYRFGGEEFIILLECREHRDFLSVMTRIMETVRQHTFNFPEGSTNITVTCGVTMAAEPDLLQNIIDRADKAMYYGKQHGRNQCRLWAKNHMVNIEENHS